MAKMKFDMSGVKQFLFEKGEKVGLIACTAIMVLVVGYALYSGFTSRGTESGKDWDRAIVDASDVVKRKIQGASLRPEEIPPPIDVQTTMWNTFYSTYAYLSMFPMPDKAFTKKLNPNVLPIMSGDDGKYFQLSYYATGTYMYKIDTAKKKATVIKGGAGGEGKNIVAPGGAAMQGGKGAAAQSNLTNLAKHVRPTRLVVVCAKFPMQEQLEEFRKALRYASLAELLMHKDELPKPLGLEVSRCEILPDGKPVIQANGTPWTPLFRFEKGKPVASPEIKDVMRRMLVDEEQQQLAAQYVFPGLVTPLPKLAYSHYAKVDLKDFDIKEAQNVAEAGAEVGPMGAAAGAFQPKGIGMMPNFGGKKGLMPAAPGGEQGGAAGAGNAPGQDIRLQEEFWAKLAPEFKNKFEEKFNVFDPLASTGGEKKQAGGGFVAPGSGPKGMGEGGMGMGAGASGGGVFGWELILGGMGGGAGMIGGGGLVPGGNPPRGGMGEEVGGEEGVKPAAGPVTVHINDALVRFFDPAVEPGKTYRYTIRVRMANPNYGKKSDVAFQALADQKELEPFPTQFQGWVMTPAITIPSDYHWYAIDQTPVEKIKGGADSGLPQPGTTPIQVHRWSDMVQDGGSEFITADYAIAERLFLRRGEFIGRQRIMIEIPTWQLITQAWGVGHAAQAAKRGPAKGESIAAGVPIELITTPPALLVDFEGGRRTYVEKRDGGKDYSYGEDTSAVEVLALSPEGRLVMRNSRIDSDTETTAGIERRERYDQWRERLGDIRSGANGPRGGGPVMPGGNPPRGGEAGGKGG